MTNRCIRSLLALLALVPVSLLNSCATAQLSAVPLGAASEAAKTGLILDYEILTESDLVKQSGCDVVLRNLDLRKSFSLHLSAAESWAFVEAPPGRYLFESVYCYSTKQFEVRDSLGFAEKVVDGKLSYAGPYRFQVPADRSDLLVSVTNGAPDLPKIFASLSTEARSKLISAYSGKPITEATLKSAGPRMIWYKAVDPSDVPSFDECVKQESKVNALPIGELSLRAHYRSGVFADLKVLEDSSTYSDSFIQCAETTLKTFRPKANGPVVIQVRHGSQEAT